MKTKKLNWFIIIIIPLIYTFYRESEVVLWQLLNKDDYAPLYKFMYQQLAIAFICGVGLPIFIKTKSIKLKIYLLIIYISLTLFFIYNFYQNNSKLGIGNSIDLEQFKEK